VPSKQGFWLCERDGAAQALRKCMEVRNALLAAFIFNGVSWTR
jgi:hypothetical protein